MHIARGSLSTIGSSAGEGCPIIMDASVWSRLPDDILRRVLLWLPAAKLFQLHFVSPKWRQLLTSAAFRDAFVAAAPTTQSAAEQQGAVAMATCGVIVSVSDLFATMSRSRLRVVDFDLTFLPRNWFRVSDADCEPADRTKVGWARRKLASLADREACANPPYYVLAAADGMVCIANGEWNQRPQVCVINPVTRTYKMLADLPKQAAETPPQWLLTATGAGRATVTALMVRAVEPGREYADWGMGTCELTRSGGAAQWVVRRGCVHTPKPGAELGPPDLQVAICGGEVFWYLDSCQRLLVTGPGIPDAAPDALDAPSVELLGLDAATVTYGSDASLAAHRGSVFLVARLYHKGDETVPSDAQVVCGVWRLERAHRQMEWQPVALLHMADVRRLTSFGPAHHVRGVDGVRGACGVRELLCCVVEVGLIEPPFGLRVLLGFNLDTGLWEQVHADHALTFVYKFHNLKGPVELRPDLFLS